MRKERDPTFDVGVPFVPQPKSHERVEPIEIHSAAVAMHTSASTCIRSKAGTDAFEP